MGKIKTGLLATVLSISFAATATVPVNAATIYVPQAQAQASDVINVSDRSSRRYRIYRQHRRHRDYRRHDGHYYWRGHRGYRHYRPGYRRHGDLWFPLAAFATGAIIGGALANDRPPAYSGNAHIRWCYNRYRSYRASDNTYQPYHGPRRQCVSPY
jgi:hypothetical protein